MSSLIAFDVAILPPPALAERALALSAALPDEESKGLRLGPAARPHVTLTQQFVREEEIDAAVGRVDEIVRGLPPVELRVTGGTVHGSTVWMSIEASPELIVLHERLMEALRGWERSGGTPGAFAGEGVRMADVLWVASYRLQSAFGAWTPHITLGHASAPPVIEPLVVEADTVAACHLGAFCTCRDVIREWRLGARPAGLAP
jgi:hypothetical protein